LSKGQKVADIYSPELITAQRELLFLLENDPANTSMIESSRKRLALLGLTDSQIHSLVTRKTVDNTFTLYSPYSGYAIPPGEIAPASPGGSPSATAESNGMGDGMESTSPEKPSGEAASPAKTTALMREGNYVSAGQTLFKIVNNASLRIELDLPAEVASSVKRGDQLNMDFGAGHKHMAVVDFIQPYFDKDREFVRVRVNTSNTDNLHIGHLLHARIKSDSIEGMWVPRQAVLDLGKEKVVFLRVNKTFVPRQVETGITSEGQTLIIKGITSKDEIAENAQFLIDSESIIKSEK
jgi:Cu(I)/Ag(I) efflux system membrane fusion protein